MYVAPKISCIVAVEPSESEFCYEYSVATCWVPFSLCCKLNVGPTL